MWRVFFFNPCIAFPFLPCIISQMRVVESLYTSNYLCILECLPFISSHLYPHFVQSLTYKVVESFYISGITTFISFYSVLIGQANDITPHRFSLLDQCSYLVDFSHFPLSLSKVCKYWSGP